MSEQTKPGPTQGERLEALWQNGYAAGHAAAAGPPREVTTEMIDAAMAAMDNISPPLRRGECSELIRAALYAAPPAASADQSTMRLRLYDWLRRHIDDEPPECPHGIIIGCEICAANTAASAAPKAEPIPVTVDDIDDLWRCPKSGKTCGEFKTGQGMVCSRKHECDGAEPTRPVPPTPDDGRSDAPAGTDAELLHKLKWADANPSGVESWRDLVAVAHARLRELLAQHEADAGRIAELERSINALRAFKKSGPQCG